MNPVWYTVADCLRQEISEYGAMLNLFEQQQRQLFARDAEGVMRLSADIEAQVRTLHDCRRTREEAVIAFATSRGEPAGATLRSLLPHFDADVRPLLEALITEVNLLVHRIRRTSRHNNALLARAVETHQQALRQLRPDSFPQTYAPNGRMTAGGVHPTPALQAAG